jgi:serine/threonine-protein kinase
MIVADPGVPGGERTKLLDFGIAKLADAKDFVKTRTNAMMGTPVYMSPEQCRGAGRVDDRSDVYSFGVLLFVMLSGRAPFNGEGLGDIMGKHMYEPPPPIEDFVPEVAAPLADLVARLLLKDKQQRPPMREVVAELEELAKTLPSLPKKQRSAPVIGPAVVSEPTAPTLAGQTQTQPLMGQTVSSSTIVKPGGSLRRATLVLFGLVALLLPASIVIPTLLRSKTPAPSASPPAQPAETPATQLSAGATAPRPVRWQITTTPPGASVTRDSDGKVLCQTPCVHEQTPSTGRAQLRLRREGFLDRVVELAQDSDVQLRETLAPLRRPVKGKQPARLATSQPAAPSATPPPAEPPVKPEPPVNRVHARPKIED